jgi:acyl carrier protein
MSLFWKTGTRKQWITSKSYNMENQIVSLLQKMLNNPDIQLGTKREDIQNWDSLNHLRLMIEIEELFSIEIEPEEMATINSVESILILLQSKNI